MLKAFVVRTAPVSNSPMIVDANSLKGHRLTAILDNQQVEISEDFYKSSGSVDFENAVKIVKAYAEQNNLPSTEYIVRQRLPKTMKKRQTNDAHMVGGGQPQRRASDKQADNTQEKESMNQNDDLAKAAQQLHDKETQKQPEQGAKQDVPQSEEGKATASNPEGATVTPIDRVKRKYTRKTKEQSARSKAALKRMQDEIAAASEKNDLNFEPAASNVSPEQYDDEVMKLARALAKILKAADSE